MRRIKCRVCLEWFEQNQSGICSEECLHFAKKRVTKVSPKPLDPSWNEKLREERQKKKSAYQKHSQWKAAKKVLLKKIPPVIQKPPSIGHKPSQQMGSSKKKLRKRIIELEKKLSAFQSESRAKPPSFYDSREWKELRYSAIRKYGRVCMACRRSDGVMHVDHVKPRSKFPSLELELSNLQILCADCNMGKSNKDSTDWRELR